MNVIVYFLYGDIVDLLWLIIMLLLIIVESQTLNFIALWFSLGSFFTYLSTFYIDEFSIQFLIFAVGGIITELLMRDRLFRKLNKKVNKNSK